MGLIVSTVNSCTKRLISYNSKNNVPLRATIVEQQNEL